jgi:hypothetical protein
MRLDNLTDEWDEQRPRDHDDWAGMEFGHFFDLYVVCCPQGIML